MPRAYHGDVGDHTPDADGHRSHGLSAFRPIRLRKASEEVLAALIDAVRGGLYQPGDLLPRERDLADQLEVSRTVVRSAIETLRQAGVVSVRRGRSGGTLVASTSGLVEVLARMEGRTISDLRSILEARRALELSAGVLAATRLSDNDLAELRRLVEKLPRLLDEPERFYEADITFHLSVAARSGSEVIADHLRDTFRRLAQIRAQYPFAHVDLFEAVDNQQHLLSALASRDRRLILRAVDDHLAAFECVMLGQPLDFLPIKDGSLG
jgi:GntR family transcriptional regulator, transcriptional repressor for pyruvate dehydrogenase complex